MKWASAVSRQVDLDRAIIEASAAVRVALGGDADFAAVFVSPQHAESYERIPSAVLAALGARVLVGCSAGGVIGGGREIEDEAGFSLTAACLPGAEITSFHVDGSSSDDPALRGGGAAADFLLLADPWGFDAEEFLRALDAECPDAKKIGGLASGGREPGENALFDGERIHRSGLVGVRFGGSVEIDTLVAQGCRPVGDPMFVTRARGNAILALDGRSPIESLQDLYESLEPPDRQLLRHSLFIGFVMREQRDAYRQGDFLIRNLIGLDQEQEALLVGTLVRDGTIVQFHLRDAETSARDLREALTALPAEARSDVRGSLLFSCLGRGRHLYGRPDHDTDLFRHGIGDVPLGGFFCNGEIGPVQGKTFLHGYTSAFGLFKPRR
jgi:small ligand-binding sensory domain FIST